MLILSAKLKGDISERVLLLSGNLSGDTNHSDENYIMLSSKKKTLKKK